MAVKSSNVLLLTFQKRLIVLNKIREKQERLFHGKDIGLNDIEEVYGATFISAVASFESLIEELFFGLLLGKFSSQHCIAKARMSVKNEKIAREIVFQEKPYINWLPYDNTEKISKRFLIDGNPFCIIDADDKKHISKCLLVRNAIAHQSRHSIVQFDDKVINGMTLTRRERKPKGFLRAEFSHAPKETYWGRYMSDLLRVAGKFC